MHRRVRGIKIYPIVAHIFYTNFADRVRRKSEYQNNVDVMYVSPQTGW